MNTFTKSIPFSKVKVGQSFSYGDGFGRSVYVKTNQTQARLRVGQTHHVYGFTDQIIVSIEAEIS